VIHLAENDRPLEIGIPVGHIRNQSVASARSIGAHLRRERETTLNIERSTPLPTSEYFVPNWQWIKKVRVELVFEIERSQTSGQAQIKRIQDVCGFIRS
jgi:hypothetical protein